MTQQANPNKPHGSSGTARFSPSLQNAILIAQNEKKHLHLPRHLKSTIRYISFIPLQIRNCLISLQL